MSLNITTSLFPSFIEPICKLKIASLFPPFIELMGKPKEDYP